MRDYLARFDIIGSENFTMRTPAHHQARQALDTLRRHLRSHRLRAVVIKHHYQHAVPPLARRDTAASAARPATASGGSEGDPCGTRKSGKRTSRKPPAGPGGNNERLYHYRADNRLAKVKECDRRVRRMTACAYDAL